MLEMIPMSKFEIVVLGVGDSFSERHHTSALLLICDGFSLAIDCPDAYRRVLQDASRKSGIELSLDSIEHFLITHIHGDHMNGLEGVAFFKHFVEAKQLNLLCSPELLSTIWDSRLRSSMSTLFDGQIMKSLDFESYFKATELSWTESTRVGPFSIRTRRTLHHVPTSALMIEACGSSFGYSSDTGFDESLIEFLAPADLIIHETNFGPAHTPYSALLALPSPLRHKMRLIHYPDAFTELATEIQKLEEGQVLRV